MLLTISTTHDPATDLGYPAAQASRPGTGVRRGRSAWRRCSTPRRPPSAAPPRCCSTSTRSGSPRGRARNSPDFSLAQYVNDRPYAASSLLGVALADVFSTARAGRCAARQELADAAIPLEIAVPSLPCRGGTEVARRVFGPLGWAVEAEPIALDEAFPEWGDSRYVRLRLRGVVRLADALNQLYVLLPVLDESKHYWQGPDEVDKLLRSGEGWLAHHPDKDLITRRYLGRRGGLARVALARLAELGDEVEDTIEPAEDEEALQPEAKRVPLNTERHEAVCAGAARPRGQVGDRPGLRPRAVPAPAW